MLSYMMLIKSCRYNILAIKLGKFFDLKLSMNWTNQRSHNGRAVRDFKINCGAIPGVGLGFYLIVNNKNL